MNATNGNCLNKCENYPNCKPCGNYLERYKTMKKSMGWTNQDIADITGNSLNSIEVVTTKPDDSFPRWAKLSIVLYEQMIARGRVTYEEPEPYQGGGGKE
jgi:hypothetical protein